MQFRNLIKNNITNIDPTLYTAVNAYIDYLDNLNSNNKLRTLFNLLQECLNKYGLTSKGVYAINYNLMDCHISLDDANINSALNNDNILINTCDEFDSKTTYEYGIQLAVLQSEQFIRNIVSHYGDKGIHIVKHPNGADAFPDFDFIYKGETYHVEIKATLCKLSGTDNDEHLVAMFNNGINNKNAVLDDIKNKDSLLRNTLCMNVYYYIDVDSLAFVYIGIDVYPIVLAVKWKYDDVNMKVYDLLTRSNGENSTNNNALISTGKMRGITKYNKFDILISYINDTIIMPDNYYNIVDNINVQINLVSTQYIKVQDTKNICSNYNIKKNQVKLLNSINKLYKLRNKLEEYIDILKPYSNILTYQTNITLYDSYTNIINNATAVLNNTIIEH